MQIQIKELLLEGRVTDHLKRNWGKYTTGAVGTGLAGVYAAGQGALGVDAQDAVQDWGGETAGDLENYAHENKVKATRDAAIETFSRPDNIISNWDENKETLDFQKGIQKETHIGNAQEALASGVRGLTGMSGEPDQTNFVVRNPDIAGRLQMDRGIGYVRPYFKGN